MSSQPNASETKVTFREQRIAEHYINSITETSLPRSMKLEEVKAATSSDKTLMKAMEYLRTCRAMV